MPFSSFGCFCKDHRAEVKEKDPTAQISGGRLLMMWESLTNEQREVGYMKIEKQSYKTEIEEYRFEYLN